ncbi:hypothetical protein DYB37_005930 [Aphanomyces astaci]|uniref:Pre-mRNA-splicing factor SPF27 n=2 Tax=Aphanomyces astaci TaxID=112090 RepID=A0A397B5E1_APHAT|nr:hypothetical protein DYB36_005498 [Aphanomyces astaci]RHY42621.1 hypothetical protein DYB30_002662 [Aphanomyces astaci]RHZ24641.1 hypothetical protein DYB37_005930 [Aphanomyces astaci]RLO07020.1 hypothetical protein DYB28_015405 [Aphanomyces astaci]RQM27882.1 hypothetical protein B5M09_007034 [Aphanomyces astaci]
MSEPLQLTCPLLNETRHLVDCLGYVDTNYASGDVAMQKLVKLQIEQQLAQMPPCDDAHYLAYLPPLNLKLDSREMKRVAAKVKLTSIDTNKYRVVPPAPSQLKKQSQEVQLEAWQQATDHAKVAIEYQQTKILNLEMQNKYGANRWKLQVGVLHGINERCKSELDDVRKQTDQVNMERKEEQLLNADKLQGLERKRNDLTLKTQWIQVPTPPLIPSPYLKRVKPNPIE